MSDKPNVTGWCDACGHNVQWNTLTEVNGAPAAGIMLCAECIAKSRAALANDAPTPETDAFMGDIPETDSSADEFRDPAWAEFARKLERERDEALSRLDVAMAAHDAANEALDDALSALRALWPFVKADDRLTYRKEFEDKIDRLVGKAGA